MELRIAEDGELLVRGPLVMAGYRGATTSPPRPIDADGWLHTGDVARIDEDGYVWIVDRKKELIINAAGKNMSPANIEMRLKAAGPLIGQACVFGDRRPYNVAVLVLDPDTAAGLDPADPAVVARVQAEVDEANSHLSRVEQIKRFRLLRDGVAAGRRGADADDEAEAARDRGEVRGRGGGAVRGGSTAGTRRGPAARATPRPRTAPRAPVPGGAEGRPAWVPVPHHAVRVRRYCWPPTG